MVDVGHTLEDAKEALVELEVIGFRFFIDNGLHYQGTEMEDLNGRLIPIQKDYLKRRLDLVREYRDDISSWLQTRTKADIARCLDKVTDKVSAMAVAWQRHAEAYQAEAEKIWDHWTKVYSTLLILTDQLATNDAAQLAGEVDCHTGTINARGDDHDTNNTTSGEGKDAGNPGFIRRLQEASAAGGAACA